MRGCEGKAAARVGRPDSSIPHLRPILDAANELLEPVLGEPSVRRAITASPRNTACTDPYLYGATRMPQPPHVPTPGIDTGEFDRHDAAASAAAQHLGFEGRCYGSKSGYRDRHPHHLVIFNANVCTRRDGKIWWGDLDVTVTFREIRALAEELGVTVYVLRELDARFDTAEAPLFHQAVYATDWHDDGFVPTREWAVEEGRRRRGSTPGT